MFLSFLTLRVLLAPKPCDTSSKPGAENTAYTNGSRGKTPEGSLSPCSNSRRFVPASTRPTNHPHAGARSATECPSQQSPTSYRSPPATPAAPRPSGSESTAQLRAGSDHRMSRTSLPSRHQDSAPSESTPPPAAPEPPGTSTPSPPGHAAPEMFRTDNSRPSAQTTTRPPPALSG